MNTPPRLPDAWQGGVSALRDLPPSGVALLIGASDRGKSTFAALAARTLATEGRRVLLVDTDVGQGEVGPPGVVGVAVASAEKERVAQWGVPARFFVGATSPAAAFADFLVAVAHAIRWARAAKPDAIIVDTTGMVQGWLGQRLKTAKTRLVAPDVILTFGTGDAEATLLAALRAVSDAPIVALPKPPAIGTKPAALRATRRKTRLYAALENSQPLFLRLHDLTVSGAVLGTGTPLGVPEIRDAQQEMAQIVYGERDDAGVTTYFCDTPTSRVPASSAEVRYVAIPAYANVYVGLCEQGGRCVAVGRCLGWDAERRGVLVDTPLRSSDGVRLLQFGRFRVAADGSPMGAVRGAEI